MMRTRTLQPAAVETTGRSGFTLIELVVVMAVVTATVMMAAPAMNEVSRRSRRLSCQTQLGALATGLAGVAADCGGRLPAGPIERTFSAGPHELYRAIADRRLAPVDGWFGMGLTWRLGYVSAGRSFYCPQAPRHGDVAFGQAWPTAFDDQRNPADGKWKIYSSYAYRGGLPGASDAAWAPVNLYRDGASAVVLADNPMDGRMWHEGGYNLAAADGSVRFQQTRSAILPDGYLPGFWLALEAGAPADK
jgi:prepilin-type N-terminal cleavage/methylation domain-containing protein